MGGSSEPSRVKGQGSTVWGQPHTHNKVKNSTIWHKHLLSTILNSSFLLPLSKLSLSLKEEQCKVLIVLETELCLGVENHDSCSLVVGEGGGGVRHSKMHSKKIDSKSVSFITTDQCHPVHFLHIFHNVTVFFTSKFRFTPQMTMWHDSFISLVCVLICLWFISRSRSLRHINLPCDQWASTIKI